MNLHELKELAWVLMLFPFAFVLGVGLVFYCSAVRKKKNKISLIHRDGKFPLWSGLPDLNPSPFQFAPPPVWIAIKNSNSAQVQSALGLYDLALCSWEIGLLQARQNKLFVSPPVSGWILVVGSGLPTPDENIDECFQFLTELSRKVGHIQYFCAEPIFNSHAWAILDDGKVFRAFAWARTTLWNQGVITAAEKELKMVCPDYATEIKFAEKDFMVSNTEKVLRLAGSWSLNPFEIGRNNSRNSQGIVGSFSQSKLH